MRVSFRAFRNENPAPPSPPFPFPRASANSAPPPSGRQSTMPLTTTHAMVPLAAALAGSQSLRLSRLLVAATAAAAVPDADVLVQHFARLASTSAYAHRGSPALSLFARRRARLVIRIRGLARAWLRSPGPLTHSGRPAPDSLRSESSDLSCGLAQSSHGHSRSVLRRCQPSRNHRGPAARHRRRDASRPLGPAAARVRGKKGKRQGGRRKAHRENGVRLPVQARLDRSVARQPA
jgi:hypothetical protein